MLFAEKLKNEEYTPWEQHYIAYDQLKKLLKESVTQVVDWTEDDESRFVQLLDRELDKVYGFETAKFEELSSRLTKVEEQMSSVEHGLDKSTERELEQILDDTTHLDRFRRINYTGFAKIVRKHDRIHSRYQVWPLLQARFKSSPFHADDYRPLLRRLGQLYTQLDAELGITGSALARSHALNSVDKDYHSKGYVTLQFWVHPDNLMEVKTRILRKLPVLVYNREDEDEESDRDPIVTSLYLDNRQFSLYQSLLDQTEIQTDLNASSSIAPSVPSVAGSTDLDQDVFEGEGAASKASPDQDDKGPASLRFRWYGKLYERPDIVLERHNEQDGRITRVNVKEKSINRFLRGNREVVEKQARKMKDRHVQSRAIEDYTGAASELQRFVINNKLEPMLRTVYRRTAFEIPGDDRVRVILDQDILFLREDALDRQRPVRDTADWHRPDLDQPGISPQSVLRKGEFARFPYSVLEVRLKAGGNSSNGTEKMPWIEELQASGLIKEIPHFTKFLHGVAVLFGDDDRLDTLPFWLSELDPAHAQQNHQGTDNNTSGQNQEGSSQVYSQAGPSTNPPGSRRLNPDYKFDDDEYAELDSDDSGVLGEFGPSDSEMDEEDIIGLPTRIRGKLGNEESEDEEVNLPPGVERPSQWIKNQSSPKIEAKVWLANERTFNKWLHITCLMSALTFTLYSSVGRASSEKVANFVAFTLFALTLFCGVWGYVQYNKRMQYIRNREDKPMDAPFGPIVVSVVLLIALIVNFAAVYRSR